MGIIHGPTSVHFEVTGSNLTALRAAADDHLRRLAPDVDDDLDWLTTIDVRPTSQMMSPDGTAAPVTSWQGSVYATLKFKA